MWLVFGTLAWVATFIWLGKALYGGDVRQSEPMSYALVGGLPTGILAYALAAWLRPGILGADRVAPSDPVVVPDRVPKSTGEWLLLDLRAVPKVLRRQRRRGK
jgi:hypothetical protein